MTSPFPQITSPPQASAEVILNEALETLQHQAVYGLDQGTTSGLTWGYYGGRWGGFAITAGTLSLTASATNDIVVEIATGDISVGVGTDSAWSDSDYLRVYRITTGGSSVATVEDHRAGPDGVHGGGSGVGGGTGTVTHTGGALTSNRVVLGAGTDDTKVVAGITTDGTSALNLGVAGSSVGKVVLANATSGSITIQPPTGALGSVTLTAPATTGTLATNSQAGEMISGYIGTVSDKTYKLVVKAAHGGTITEATTISESGTVTATFKINTTALGGTANSVSTSETSQSHASANVFAAGDDIQLTTSSNSSCLGLSFTLKYTRTLA